MTFPASEGGNGKGKGKGVGFFVCLFLLTTKTGWIDLGEFPGGCLARIQYFP